MEAKLETRSEGVWEPAFRPCNTGKDRGRNKDGAEVTVYLQKREKKNNQGWGSLVGCRLWGAVSKLQNSAATLAFGVE